MKAFAAVCGANAGTWQAHAPLASMPITGRRAKTLFIVQGKPREPEGIEKATADSREEALETASDFLNRGFPFVTVVADGRVYTVDEFAMTVVNRRKHGRSL